MYDYGRLGERKRSFQLPLIEIASAILLLGAIVLGMIELVAYSNQQESLPTDLTVAGIAVGGLSERDAQSRWEAAYLEQPIQLLYEGSPILLFPEEINFRVNSDAMLAEARAQTSQEKNYWAGFWNYLERRPVAAVSVPLQAEYTPSDLRLYLENLARRYDIHGGVTLFDPATLTFSSGSSGRQLDIEAAIPLIDQVLFDPEPSHRVVNLPTIRSSAAQQNLQTLREAILQLMTAMDFDYDGTATVASVYVMDLRSGDTLEILADVPFSALSSMKIPIMINFFRDRLVIAPEEAYLLTESILCSNNASSNWLMQLAGEGADANAQLRDGLNQVSCTAQSLGAGHTYISAPLNVADSEFQFEAVVCRPDTPANTAFATEPDVYSQSTAEDMGLLLTEIYDCANHGSGLMAIYPQDISPLECQQMLNLLSGNRIDRLIELGVPLGTRVAHKNAWGPAGTSGDAAIVFSPGGDYVLVIYTYEFRDPALPIEQRLPTLKSWGVIEEISRLTYNYFNPTAPLFERRAPINQNGAIHCVTVGRPEEVDLNDINRNRLDAQGNPLPTACYGGAGDCGTFAGWDQEPQ